MPVGYDVRYVAAETDALAFKQVIDEFRARHEPEEIGATGGWADKTSFLRADIPPEISAEGSTTKINKWAHGRAAKDPMFRGSNPVLAVGWLERLQHWLVFGSFGQEV